MSHLIQDPVAHLLDSYFIVTTLPTPFTTTEITLRQTFFPAPVTPHCPVQAQALTSLVLGSTGLLGMSFAFLLLIRV